MGHCVGTSVGKGPAQLIPCKNICTHVQAFAFAFKIIAFKIIAKNLIRI